MIIYFSGTGNSQYVAVRVAKAVEDETVSINRYLKKGEKAAVRSEKPLVFTAPTYSWRLPGVVEKWILETEFTGNRNAYFILTCGGSCGNAAAYAKKLCEKKRLVFCGFSQVIMPENYLALFPTPEEAECQAIIEKAGPGIDELAGMIRDGRHFPKKPVSITEKLLSGPVNPLFYSLFVHDKGFWVSENCVSCGKCVQRCPMNNISLADGKPVWKGNCTHCMACIGGCPAGAIGYKTKSKGRRRHYIMDDTLCYGEGGREH